MVAAAVTAARSGELTVGEGTRLRKDEWLFAPVVALLGLAGAGLWSFAAFVAFSNEPGSHEPQLVLGQGWSVELPGDWTRVPEAEEVFGGAAVVYGDGGAEVVILTTAAPRPEGPLRPRLESLGALGDEVSSRRGTVELARALAFDGQHMTPRGPAHTRLIAFARGRELRTVQVICSDDTGAGLCPPVVASLTLTGPTDARVALEPPQPGR